MGDKPDTIIIEFSEGIVQVTDSPQIDETSLYDVYSKFNGEGRCLSGPRTSIPGHVLIKYMKEVIPTHYKKFSGILKIKRVS